MPKNNQHHNWLMEIATHFGMSISEFCSSIGYSRQAIYMASAGMAKLDARRFAVAIDNLQRLNQLTEEKAIAKAVEDFEIRQKLIEAMAVRLRTTEAEDA